MIATQSEQDLFMSRSVRPKHEIGNITFFRHPLGGSLFLHGPLLLPCILHWPCATMSFSYSGAGPGIFHVGAGAVWLLQSESDE